MLHQTPRQTFPEPDRHTEIAIGSGGQCRDFRQLEKWANERSGCYKFTHLEDETWHTVDRAKYCPADSPYLPLVRAHFGFDEGWLPDYDTPDEL